MASANQSIIATRSNLPSPSSPHPNVVAAVVFIAPLAVGAYLSLVTLNPVGAIAGAVLGFLAAQAPKIAKQWEKAVVLRLGRYIGLKGPGLFWVIPFIHTVSARVH